MRKMTKFVAAAVLTLSLAPLGARASHNPCDVFMFSGRQPVGAVNLGAAGCSGNHSTGGTTSYITPGADFVRGGVLVSASATVPTGASITFLNGSTVIETVPVTFAIDPGSTGRYVTGDIGITGARAAATAIRIDATLAAGARSGLYQRIV